MIIGNSREGKSFHLYRNQTDPFDEILVNWVDGEEISNYTDFEEDYKLIQYVDMPFVENDDWTFSKGYHSRNNTLLVECDYCEERFLLNESLRYSRASAYRQSLNKAGFGVTPEDDFLYKDNCPSCKINKTRETTLMTKGYTHISHSPEYKEMMREVQKDTGFIKTSRGQRYIAKLFNAELNVLVGYYYADMILDNKVVIEYDGGGHNLSVIYGDQTQEEFDRNERKRSGYFFSKGYKIVRFISHNEYFPEEEVTKRIICEAIASLYLNDSREIHITIGNKVDDKRYGKLKPIKRILESSEWGADIL